MSFYFCKLIARLKFFFANVYIRNCYLKKNIPPSNICNLYVVFNVKNRNIFMMNYLLTTYISGVHFVVFLRV